MSTMGGSSGDLPEQALAAALAGLERMTAGRLDILLTNQTPSAALAMITGELAPSGLVERLFDTDGLLAAWRNGLRRRPPAQLWDRCVRLGIGVLVRGFDGYPPMLLDDPAPAPVLFIRGSLTGVTGRRVSVVGTRNATGSGREIAAGLGRDLAAQGVHVVSGLARGIDGCAHRGALSVDGGAVPVAVVASGLDVVYPREHHRLWDLIAERGAVVSEAPPGTAPEAYRFPLRNRIIAGLSEIVVVVESRESGGSLITVNEARLRGVSVMAVPGALGNRAARGTNELIRDGCAVVTETSDVVVAYDPRPRPTREDRETLAMCCEPRTLDQLTLLTGRSLVECAMSMARLEANGWVRQVSGWFEATSANASLL